VNVLLDTDVAIEILRERDPKIVSQWSELVSSGKPILCTPVVIAEVWAGARPQEHRVITAFFELLVCLPTDDETGRLAGGLLHKYMRSHCLEVPDALIAAAAIQHQAALWTRNRKHYPMSQISFYS
jgi:predicted nucleic acid-binding protein